MAASEIVEGGHELEWPASNPVVSASQVEDVLSADPSATIRGGAGTLRDLTPFHDAGYVLVPGTAGRYTRLVSMSGGLFEVAVADPAAVWASEWTARLMGYGAPLSTAGASSASSGEKPALAPTTPLAVAAAQAAAAGAAATVRTGVALLLGALALLALWRSS